ncbi:hypothetical protein SAMN05192574_11524 [Mucilaginibacter gossypiicola]|uniref:Uncharacterized protein n=1 Tax=Mucilaginibacter gossypiicola TaxID=551995 RepID=A0A1H8TAS5_9SPHI|nr:hypothetical protein [Mucilaginibacter gossypiicola]SEO88037.1 hypothetical protein SAMN05192574_11524 [Mucilaginibacter gossypiicola]
MEIVDKIKEIFEPTFEVLKVTRSGPDSLNAGAYITIDAKHEGKSHKRVFREAELVQLNAEGKLAETIRALCAVMLTSEE